MIEHGSELSQKWDQVCDENFMTMWYPNDVEDHRLDPDFSRRYSRWVLVTARLRQGMR